MSQPARLEERVTQLETEMAEVRFLATKAEKEAADFQAVLRGHTGTINAIREDQVEHGKKLARVEAAMRNGFAKVDQRFDKIDERFDKIDQRFATVDQRFDKLEAKVEDKFAVLQRGQESITRLLTRQLGEPGTEACAGGADE